MKKYLLFAMLANLMLSPCSGTVQIKSYTAAPNNDSDYIRNEIAYLEKELATKTEKLNACASKNKNFQIAGIATVGLAGAGVATNISLYSKMKDQKKQADNMMKTINAADAQANDLLKEMERLTANLDLDRFVRALDGSLTQSERERITELQNQNWDLGADTDSVSDSDKLLLEKIIKAMKNSQKA